MKKRRPTLKKLKTMDNIVMYLKEKEMSIAELTKKTNMSRTNLIHYLNILEEEGYIKRKRIERKRIGRPTIIKLNKKRFIQEEKEFKEKAKEIEKEYYKSINTKDILKILLRNKEITRKDLNFNLVSINKSRKQNLNVTPNIMILQWMESKGFIENIYRIRPRGRKLFKFLTK